MSNVFEISPQPATSTPPHDAATTGRPDISIYWMPGCSNCLRMKEFLESTGLPFEALNVTEQEDALEEITRAGFRSDLERWLAAACGSTIPRRMATFYGEQESSQVLERAVWQCAQHIRQLDIVAAGRLRAEFEISPSLYDGLPLPKRLWV